MTILRQQFNIRTVNPAAVEDYRQRTAEMTPSTSGLFRCAECEQVKSLSGSRSLAIPGSSKRRKVCAGCVSFCKKSEAA